MPDVTVHPHGVRWAVAESGAASPLREFETREAAESAARQLAEGGAVDVVEDDPTSLSGPAPAGDAEAEDAPRARGRPARPRAHTHRAGWPLARPP
jgi:hypothetical protein